jgi:hypothetical protein
MRPQRGRTARNFERPDWGPLADLAPEHLEDFMWVCEIEMEDGLRLHAYKHRETRRYMHLDHFGRAYVYVSSVKLAADDDGHYEEVDPQWLLRLATDAERGAMFLGEMCCLSSSESAGRGLPAATESRGAASAVFLGDADCSLRSPRQPVRQPGPVGASCTSATTRKAGPSR